MAKVFLPFSDFSSVPDPEWLPELDWLPAEEGGASRLLSSSLLCVRSPPSELLSESLRAERDEEEARRRKAQATSFLNAASKASNPAKVFSSQWKVLPADREMIAKDMLSRPGSEIYSRVGPGKSFPADKAGNSFWTRAFYRYLDTMEPSKLQMPS